MLVVEHAGFANFERESIAATVAERAKQGGYRAVVLGFSAQGRDLGPRVAAKLDAPIASDVTEISVAGDAITVKHPGYANKVIVTLTLSGSPVVLSVRPGAFTAKEAARSARTESIQPAADPSAARVVVKQVVEGAKGRPDLGEAPVIVAGGRGLKAAENFKLVEELADAFGNAAVGATRAVTDDGWRPHSDQIGQTGRQVSPQLYVAVGISGAIQHLAGMRTSQDDRRDQQGQGRADLQGRRLRHRRRRVRGRAGADRGGEGGTRVALIEACRARIRCIAFGTRRAARSRFSLDPRSSAARVVRR